MSINQQETHWVASYVNGNNLIYFDSFGIGHIPKEKKNKKSKNSLETKISLQIFTE